MEDIREACYSGNFVTLRNLVEYLGADVNERHKMNGTTPLHWAVKGGYTNVISYLITKGADPLIKDNTGNSSLDIAGKSPNNVRAALGLPANPESDYVKPKSVDGMVASTAFVPLPATPMPLPPLDSEKRIAPSISAATAPAPVAASVPAPAPQYTVVQAPVFAPSVPSTYFIQLGDAEDVIEMDFPIKSYAELVYIIYTEYHLDARNDKLVKIRKLPNILVRNDKDVARLTPGTTLQVLVTSKETTE